MKPRNFPGRRLYRALCLAWRRGETLTPAQLRFIGQPIDTRIRMGRAQRAEMTAPL